MPNLSPPPPPSPDPASGDPVIRTRRAPDCPGCRGPGSLLYEDLPDRLFGAPGTWSMRLCDEAGCGMLWLDPAPLEEDIGLAYSRYYTHGTAGGESGAEGGSADDLPWRPVYRGVVRAWLSRHRGYPAGGASAWERAASLALRVHAPRRADAECGVLYLDRVPGGRLLDVGCGSGTFLRWMETLGWQVEGVDPDPRAVRSARRRGLEVHEGTLEEQELPEASYDAVTLSHVIEHVFDPRSLLAECFRVLKPGGRLSMITPNARSLGHRAFGPDWRGLEPPRHLQVFTRTALERMTRDAGFGPVEARTTIRDADGIYVRSRLLREGHPSPADARPSRTLRARARLWQWGEWRRLRRNPDAGEEISVVATRPDSG